ncbi:MAG: hypothetical protein AAGN66_07025 [Acidobacteriota bacterium]
MNPSDPYTLRCHDFRIACVAVLILGEGHYGCQEIGGKGRSSPIIWGWDEFLEEHNLDLNNLRFGADAIANVLDSILIGPPSTRKDIESMAARIPDDELEEWLGEYLERHRTSLNNIGEAAALLARKLRAHGREEGVAE